MSKDPDKFRTSEHRWRRDEQPDGTVTYRKDGQFAPKEDYKRAFLFAQTEVDIPDPVTGGEQTVVVRRDEASALGAIANEPQEGETITVKTVDDEFIELTHQQVAEFFQEADERDRDPVRYLE